MNAQKSSFDYMWELLAPTAEFADRRGACERLWGSFDLDKQHEVYRRIRDKKRQGELVSPNPYFAIRDNISPTIQALKPPFDYNRSKLFDEEVKKGTLVTAEYQGQVGIYTEADAAKHHMRIIKHLQP